MGVFRALAGVGLAVIVAGVSGCTLDSSGLDFLPVETGDGGVPDGWVATEVAADAIVVDPVDARDDGSVGKDVHPDADGKPDGKPDLGVDRGVDARPDVTPDLAPDLGPDLVPDLVPDLGPDLVPDVRPPTDVPVDTRPTCSAGSQHLCNNVCVDDTSLASCGSSCTACPVPANGGATCDGTTCGIACNANFAPSGSTCVRSCTPACEAGAVTVDASDGGGRYTGTTTGPSNSSGSCGGSAAPESVFHIVLSAASDLFVTTHGSTFDTVVYLRNGCCGAELACNDNADGRRTSVLSATGLPAGSYDIFVDGATAADAGAFTVDIFVSPASPNAGDSCGRPTRIANAALTGTTCGMRNDAVPLNGCQATQNPGNDVIYYFVLDAPATVGFNTCTGTCIDSVIYLRDVCSDPESQLVCADDSCVGCNTSALAQQSSVTRTLAAGAHYLVVDTLGGTACGAFTITPVNVPQ